MKELILILITITTLLSCSENSNEPINKTLSDLIIGKWSVDSSLYQGKITEESKGILYIFASDKSLIKVDVHNNKYGGTWNMNETDSVLSIISGSNYTDSHIKTINDTAMIWSWVLNNEDVMEYLHKVPF